jgi:hypothetical protein
MVAAQRALCFGYIVCKPIRNEKFTTIYYIASGFYSFGANESIKPDK